MGHGLTPVDVAVDVAVYFPVDVAAAAAAAATNNQCLSHNLLMF